MNMLYPAFTVRHVLEPLNGNPGRPSSRTAKDDLRLTTTVPAAKTICSCIRGQEQLAPNECRVSRAVHFEPSKCCSKGLKSATLW